MCVYDACIYVTLITKISRNIILSPSYSILATDLPLSYYKSNVELFAVAAFSSDFYKPIKLSTSGLMIQVLAERKTGGST